MEVVVIAPNAGRDPAASWLAFALWRDGRWVGEPERVPLAIRPGRPGDDTLDLRWAAIEERLAAATVAVPNAKRWAATAQWADEVGVFWPQVQEVLDIGQLARILSPALLDARRPPSAGRADDGMQGVREIWDGLVQRALLLPVETLRQMTHIAAMLSRPLADWFQWAAETRMETFGDALPDGCRQIQSLVFRDDPDAVERAQEPAGEPEGGRTSAGDERTDGEDDPQVNDAPSSEWPLAEDLLGADGPFAQGLPGFQVRPGQLEMARAVREALADDLHLMVEAGTGTGKSLAYLVPAALHALAEDARVIVSTHTIALQDQIEHRDFPLLRRVIRRPLELAVLKGRTHYVCMRKLQQEVFSANLTTEPEELEMDLRMLAWLTETETGDREELAIRGRMHEVWGRVQSETETCIGKRCPFFRPCFYFRARARAHQADVLIANHSLVFADLKAQRRVLPHYDKLIVDEAHHLEEEATRHLGEEVHWGALLSMMQRLIRDGGRGGIVPELLSRLQGAGPPAERVVAPLEGLSVQLADLRRHVDHAFRALAELAPAGQAEHRLTPSVEASDAWRAYRTEVESIEDHIRELEHLAGRLEEAAHTDDAELAGRILDARGFIVQLVEQLRTLADGVHLTDDTWVTWVEVSIREGGRHETATRQEGAPMTPRGVQHPLQPEERPRVARGGGDGPLPLRVSLHRAPVDVASILKNALFDATPSVILTSATLTVDGRFDHAVRRLGLREAQQEGRLKTMTVASPFHLSRQALLCVPTDAPDLARMEPREAAPWVAESIVQLAGVSGGRLLALFTSYALLRATADLARPALAAQDIAVYAQGQDGGRTKLLEMFRRHPRSVLFGTQSFWEGIDLPGDQLVALVIVRLPFAPPTHPVQQARAERLKAQGLDPFAHHSLPDAVVRFRQGFGRLIRTVDDRGVVVVFDKRIVTQSYGRMFIRSLPGLRTVTGREQDVLARARAFLESPNR
ncbi:helicase C-terminal domain-containing protein [Alicyclobacillus sp.]|uniref:ATP-dependent DNA helicase n=1 Tax=Alicyclobacillus sp. TaxID=61169 RepID=UPI0025C5CB7A|nr:helicase C-terminal domain-containing protein [Alicyclobacillus sp.]MCL6515525.1 DEAD/DEAH box helicase family protein [Alicyclobacillus sp.]